MSDKSLDDAFMSGQVAIRSLTVPAAQDFPVAGPSPRRIAIHFYPSVAAAVNALTQPMTANLTGIVFTSTTPLSITQRTHGDLATKEWHLWFNVGGNVVVVEVFACPCATGH